MPQDLCLLDDDEPRWAAPADEEIAAAMTPHGAFVEAVAADLADRALLRRRLNELSTG